MTPLVIYHCHAGNQEDIIKKKIAPTCLPVKKIAPYFIEYFYGKHAYTSSKKNLLKIATRKV